MKDAQMDKWNRAAIGWGRARSGGANASTVVKPAAGERVRGLRSEAAAVRAHGC